MKNVKVLPKKFRIDKDGFIYGFFKGSVAGAVFITITVLLTACFGG